MATKKKTDPFKRSRTTKKTARRALTNLELSKALAKLTRAHNQLAKESEATWGILVTFFNFYNAAHDNNPFKPEHAGFEQGHDPVVSVYEIGADGMPRSMHGQATKTGFLEMIQHLVNSPYAKKAKDIELAAVEASKTMLEQAKLADPTPTAPPKEGES